MELNILNLGIILDNNRLVLRNEEQDIQYEYFTNIPDIYDVVIIIKIDGYDDHHMWYYCYRHFRQNNKNSNYHCIDGMNDTDDTFVFVNKRHTYFHYNIGMSRFLLDYDKTGLHTIVKMDGDIIYDRIEKMQKQLPLKIISLTINEPDIEILKPFFNITKITSVKSRDKEISLYLFTKRETLTKAAIN